jgi:hypothetical protein
MANVVKVLAVVTVVKVLKAVNVVTVVKVDTQFIYSGPATH